MFSKVLKVEACNHNLISNDLDVDFLPLEISFTQRWIRKRCFFSLPGKEAFSYSNGKVS